MSVHLAAQKEISPSRETVITAARNDHLITHYLNPFQKKHDGHQEANFKFN